MTRVVANVAWLRPGVVGGSEEYTVRLLEAVLDRDPSDVELRILGSAALRDAHPGLDRGGFSVVPGPTHLRGYRMAAESTFVHRATREADVVHHFGGRVPARRHGNDVVTIHDLQPLHVPGNFSGLKRRYLGWALPRSVASARIVATPSQWVADTVVEAFGVAPGRVRAVSSTYRADGSIDCGVADTLGSGPVLLYPAITHPHKNHLTLLAAAEQVSMTHPDVVLVLTGGEGRAEDAVAARIARTDVRVIRPGRVSAPVLQGLLSRADVLTFPSSYEGFGLPVLEAMRAGTPVVAADATALPEVVGDAALLADPDDIGAWSRQIERLLSDEPLRGRLRAAGRVRAEHYAPSAAAERLLDLWRSVG